MADEPEQHGQAVGGVRVVVHDQDASRPGALGRLAPVSRGGRPAAAASRAERAGGRRTRCPGRGPRCGRRRCRRASRPGCAPGSGRCPARPASGSQRPVGLGEQVEDARQHLRRDADPRVAHPHDDLVAPRCSTASPIRPPSSVYLAALLSRLRQHLRQPGRVGLQPARLARGARRSAWWLRPSIRGRLISTAWPTTAARSTGSLLEVDLAAADAARRPAGRPPAGSGAGPGAR